MEIEQVAIEGLIPYARNARTHSEEQVAQIAASIREFGFTNPVLVDGDGGIIAGHCRVMAAHQSRGSGLRSAGRLTTVANLVFDAALKLTYF